MKTIDFNSFTVDNGAIRDLNELLFTSIFNDPDLERTCTMVTDLTNGQKFGMLDSMGDAVGFARVIGLCLALCMGSYECWMMMLGKRGMDVMKLLRIVGLSMCITSSTWICNQLLIPGKALEKIGRASCRERV